MAETRLPTGLPSHGVRTTLSFLLFVHLFALVLCLSAYVSPSPLQQRLKYVFAPYLQTLNFDFYNSARFYLTHAGQTDVDFAIEVTPNLKTGAGELIKLPPAGLFPPIRARRYQSLANAAGALVAAEVANEEAAAILPKAVAAALLARQGVSSGKVRIQAHYLMPLEDFTALDPARRDPLNPMRYATSYDAQVLLHDGIVELLKTSAASDVAPVEKGSK